MIWLFLFLKETFYTNQCLDFMLPIFISFLIITIVNVMAYLWAYKHQSDHLTDISYSFCFIVVACYFLFAYNDLSIPRLLLFSMVLLWGIRLGGFLFYRIHQMGKDARFDAFRSSKEGFLKFWLLQSISICIIALPIIIGLKSNLSEIVWPAVILWAFGWVIESFADYQKFSFRRQHSHFEFIDTGLYTYIRHPNYLGEILIWGSIFWFITPILSDWNWITILSPIWVTILLIKVSGIPLIENTYQTKYADNVNFQRYLDRSWRLIPWVY